MKLDWLDFAWDRVETLKNTFDVLPDINDEAQVECAEDMVKLLRELADVIEWNVYRCSAEGGVDVYNFSPPEPPQSSHAQKSRN